MSCSHRPDEVASNSSHAKGEVADSPRPARASDDGRANRCDVARKPRSGQRPPLGVSRRDDASRPASPSAWKRQTIDGRSPGNASRGRWGQGMRVARRAAYRPDRARPSQAGTLGCWHGIPAPPQFTSSCPMGSFAWSSQTHPSAQRPAEATPWPEKDRVAQALHTSAESTPADVPEPDEAPAFKQLPS